MEMSRDTRVNRKRWEVVVQKEVEKEVDEKKEDEAKQEEEEHHKKE